MSDEFYRIKRMPPYVIAEVNAMRHAARQAGRDIIDLGMGNPDPVELMMDNKSAIDVALYIQPAAPWENEARRASSFLHP